MSNAARDKQLRMQLFAHHQAAMRCNSYPELENIDNTGLETRSQITKTLHRSRSMNFGADTCLRTLCGGPTRAVLICFHCAGGNALMWRSLASAIEARGTKMDVFSVQLPGRMDRFRERPFTNMDEIVQHVVDSLRVLQLERADIPMFFLGHSFGALVAYCTALACKESNILTIEHLIVMGMQSPKALSDGNLVRVPAHKLSRLPPQEALQLCTNLGGVPSSLINSPEVFRKSLTTLRADSNIVETYSHGNSTPLLTCPITALGGLQDRVLSAEGTVSEYTLERWGTCTTGTITTHMFPGGHFFFSECDDNTNRFVDIVVDVAASITLSHSLDF